MKMKMQIKNIQREEKQNFKTNLRIYYVVPLRFETPFSKK